MSFQHSNHPYLCLTNTDLNFPASTDIKGIAYCPGLVCTHCEMPLTFGIILNITDTLELWGTTCAASYDPTPWVQAIRAARYFITKSEMDLDADLPSKQQNYFRALSLYLQIFPDHTVARELRQTYLNENLLSEHQLSEVRSLLFDTGWINDLVARRDTMRRLSILTSLGNALDSEQTKIYGLLKLIKTRPLTSKQDRMVNAIQQRFASYVKTFTLKYLERWPPINGSLSIS
jgi:hypothetical protein